MGSDPTSELISPATRTETARGRTARRAWRFLRAGCVATALVHPLASLTSRNFWLSDLLSHFQEPAFVATLAAFALTVARHRRLAISLALLAAFQVVPLLRYSGPNPVTPDPLSPERLRVLMANVLFDNENYEPLIRLVRAERPDVLGLVEYTHGWDEGLASLRDEYPYRRNFPAGTSGLALWFRKPPTALEEPEWLVHEGHPIIHATFEFAGRERHFWLVHPTAPVARDHPGLGPREMAAIASRVSKTGGSRVVVGDMNTTDGSGHFRDLLAVSGLRDSRLGFGRQGSWPTDQFYRIAIDHAFVTGDLAVVDRRLGPFIGSDHFPLIVDLAPAANPATHPAHSSSSP